MPVPALEELQLLHQNICQAVGDPKRIQLLYALYEQPRNVTALVEALNTPQPTISRHLAILRERGLVIAERDGTSVVYRLGETRIIEVLDVMRQMLRTLLEKQSSIME